MTTFRNRLTVAALTLLTAGLSACANETSSPLEPTAKQRVSADVDSTNRKPTIPWTKVGPATSATSSY